MGFRGSRGLGFRGLGLRSLGFIASGFGILGFRIWFDVNACRVQTFGIAAGGFVCLRRARAGVCVCVFVSVCVFVCMCVCVFVLDVWHMITLQAVDVFGPTKYHVDHCRGWPAQRQDSFCESRLG